MFKLLEPKKGLYYAYILFFLSFNILSVSCEDNGKSLSRNHKQTALKNNMVSNSIESDGLADNSVNNHFVTQSPVKAVPPKKLFTGNKKKSECIFHFLN